MNGGILTANRALFMLLLFLRAVALVKINLDIMIILCLELF